MCFTAAHNLNHSMMDLCLHCIYFIIFLKILRKCMSLYFVPVCFSLCMWGTTQCFVPFLCLFKKFHLYILWCFYDPRHNAQCAHIAYGSPNDWLRQKHAHVAGLLYPGHAVYARHIIYIRSGMCCFKLLVPLIPNTLKQRLCFISFTWGVCALIRRRGSSAPVGDWLE